MALAASCGTQKIATVVHKPIAHFKYTQSTARPQVFTLDAAESVATLGSLATYKWTFGDGTLGMDASEATTQHAYKAAGMYSITLVVVDDRGTLSDSVTQMVSVPTVNISGPKAVLTGPSMGMLNTVLAFDGAGSTPDGDLKKYAWNFGNPAGANNLLSGADLKTQSHSYAAAGTYKVTLTVTDSLAASDTAELQVVVAAVGPISVCNWTPTPALQGVPVQFDGTGSTAPSGSTVTTYIWDFGDGSMGAGSKVNHTYNVQATFKPKLKVLDNLNRVNEAPCVEVVVAAPPSCAGDYTLGANPSQQSCGGLGTVTWAGNKLTLTESLDGGASATEVFNGGMILYSGSWAGSDFTMTGSYSTMSMGFTTQSDVTINGKFTGCTGWTGTYVEKDTLVGVGLLCTLTWNITSTKL